MATKNITPTEAQVVSWFMGQVESLKYNGGGVAKLTLVYNKAADGVSIELVREAPEETPVAPTTPTA